jgi:hypothetical protein
VVRENGQVKNLHREPAAPLMSAKQSETAPSLTDFLNLMPSNDTQDDADAEDLQEALEAATAPPPKGS